jgi:hypothetical protein
LLIQDQNKEDIKVRILLGTTTRILMRLDRQIGIPWIRLDWHLQSLDKKAPKFLCQSCHNIHITISSFVHFFLFALVTHFHSFRSYVKHLVIKKLFSCHHKYLANLDSSVVQPVRNSPHVANGSVDKIVMNGIFDQN